MTPAELEDFAQNMRDITKEGRAPGNLEECIREWADKLSPPPCTIDQLPGWDVSLLANGVMVASREGAWNTAHIRTEPAEPNGVTIEGKLHPWPSHPGVPFFLQCDRCNGRRIEQFQDGSYWCNHCEGEPTNLHLVRRSCADREIDQTDGASA